MKNLIFIKIENQDAATESGRALNGRAADRSFCSAEQSRPRTLDRSKGRTSLFAELAPPQAGQAKMAWKLKSSTIIFRFRAPLASVFGQLAGGAFLRLGNSCPDEERRELPEKMKKQKTFSFEDSQPLCLSLCRFCDSSLSKLLNRRFAAAFFVVNLKKSLLILQKASLIYFESAIWLSVANL